MTQNKTMTINQAKNDLKKRLDAFGIQYEKITGRTVSFEDLSRCGRIFLTIHGLVLTPQYWSIHGERHKGYHLNAPISPTIYPE
jgi:hypothetical protein